VAIAKAIEEEIKAQGERRGRPSKKVVERPQLDGDKTRAIAAEKAGFGTVVAVVENHTPKSGMTFAVELNGVR
jgi:hypothetical protein